MVDFLHGTGSKGGAQLDVIQPAGFQRCVGHPDNVGIEAVVDFRFVLHLHQHVATANVDLVFEGQGDRLVDVGFVQVAVEGHDFLYFAGTA